MKNEMEYLTLEEKMEVIKDRIIVGGMEDFDMSFSAEELDQMFDDDTYEEKFFTHDMCVKGYEGKTYADLNEMSFEDILTIHNICYETNKTLKEIDEMEVFYGGSRARTTITDTEGNETVVPMWMAL